MKYTDENTDWDLDDEIMNFPINNFMQDECSLFMWTTHLKLPVGLEIIKKWNLKYHCLFTWYKNTGLTMRGVFRNSEFVIFGYKGKFPFENKGKPLRTIFEGKTTGHSVKPSEFYEMLRTKTQEPRIDIFARKRHVGFDSWGDQVESNVQEVLVN